MMLLNTDPVFARPMPNDNRWPLPPITVVGGDSLSLPVLPLAETTMKRDTTWTLAIAEAFGLGSRLRAPLCPEAVRDCVNRFRDKIRSEALEEAAVHLKAEADKVRAESKNPRREPEVARALDYSARVLDEAVVAIRALKGGG